jgi:hypothetical protein
LGAVKYPTREMAFTDSIFGCSLFGKLMTIDRFNHILTAWHYEYYDGLTDAEVAALKQYNPFLAVKSLSIILAKSFKDYYQCGQLLDIDELCIPWKGQHKCRCYNLNKLEKWHLFCFCLSDAATGSIKATYIYMKGKLKIGLQMFLRLFILSMSYFHIMNI